MILESFLFIIIVLIFFWIKRPAGLPPGPKGFPVIGSLILFQKRVHQKLAKLGEKYGNIFSLPCGGSYVIVLNDFEAIKESLEKGDNFTDRPTSFLIELHHSGGGIAFSSGEIWKTLRYFGSRSLKSFGIGKSSFENQILAEMEKTINFIMMQKENPFSITYLFNKATNNIISSVILNKSYSYDDEKLDRLLFLSDVVLKNFVLTNPVNFFPFLRHVSRVFKEYEKAILEIRQYINTIIDEHIASYQPNQHRDFIDAYIKQMKENKMKSSNNYFDRDNLWKIIEDLFFGGTETVSITLLWCIIYILHNERIRIKIKNELDSVVDGNRLVTMEDQNNLPYTQAALMECQRLSSLVPLSIFRRTNKDTTIFNYFIPKGTTIIPNLWSIHYDPRYWPEPNKFKPERFLDRNGNLNKKPESFLPFSVGKRNCLGENFAKLELYLFFTNLMKQFKFTTPEDEILPDIDDYLEGITLRPKPFNVCAEPYYKT